MDDSQLLADGLLLRPFEDGDAAAFAAAVRESAEGMRRWMPWCSTDYGAEQALQWFQACRDGRAAATAYEYGAFDPDTGAFVGGAGLNAIRHDHRFCNLGYWVRQSRQGQGIATRVVHALATHAFAHMGMQRVEIVVAVGNLASERVAVKSGALRESVARNRLVIDGQSAPAHVFSLVP
ncbi:GNAT family N-acetyltransferase [Stenotrophomonas sp.]|uniref:GNAT family N-acetyltransferase n=2 Tax=Lysobacteraceae TaxID=32033 RepID=UPI00031D6799|nr:GNAT family N-acetyltransferase [Stenotrophomonas sp.]MBD3826721.1 GNAT family N-acetyltransferase [Stenotrophomonas sp.]QIO87605.1 GNAT family N-acetyltransferase [Stenotrophomonas rhizophila]